MKTKDDFIMIHDPYDKSEFFSYCSNYSMMVEEKDIIIIDPAYLIDFNKVQKEKYKGRQDIHRLEYYEGYLDDLGFNNYLIGSSYSEDCYCKYIKKCNNGFNINYNNNEILGNVINKDNNIGVFLVEEIEKCPYIEKTINKNLYTKINKFGGSIKMFLAKSLYNKNDTFIEGYGYYSENENSKPLIFRSAEQLLFKKQAENNLQKLMAQQIVFSNILNDTVNTFQKLLDLPENYFECKYLNENLKDFGCKNDEDKKEFLKELKKHIFMNIIDIM